MVGEALVEIRMLCWQENPRQAADLADAVESLPGELFGDGVFSWTHLRSLLDQYQSEYPHREGVNYLSRIDEVHRAT